MYHAGCMTMVMWFTMSQKRKVIKIPNFLFTIIYFLSWTASGVYSLCWVWLIVQWKSQASVSSTTKRWGSYVLHRHNRYSHIFKACVSPAPNRSAVMQSFEYGDAIEICWKKSFISTFQLSISTQIECTQEQMTSPILDVTNFWTLTSNSNSEAQQVLYN